ncbi:MAG: DUF3048 C-terminal domain-containing protein, partial [Firmicutes bacterium]|nr:DUF3048 C-terminal domain-containing protein [Bacillota bacterium]
GKYTPIKWYKGSDYSPYQYYLEDGTPLTLTIGKTFVCVNQKGSQVGTVDFD